MRTSTPQEAKDLAADGMVWLDRIRKAKSATELERNADEALAGLKRHRACWQIVDHFVKAITEERQKHADTPRQQSRKMAAAGDAA